MPVQEFMLDQTGTQRVQIFQDIEGKSLIVLENQSILDTLTAQEAIDIGREFTLSDGSTLKAQIVDGQIQVQRNSQIIPPTSITADSLQSIMSPVSASKLNETIGAVRAKRGGCLTTYLIIVLIGAILTVTLNLLSFFQAQSYTPDPSSGVIYQFAPLWLYVVYTLYGISMGVGTVALFRMERSTLPIIKWSMIFPVG